MTNRVLKCYFGMPRRLIDGKLNNKQIIHLLLLLIRYSCILRMCHTRTSLAMTDCFTAFAMTATTNRLRHCEEAWRSKCD